MAMKYDFNMLVNEDGTPTKEFMSLWRKDKDGVKANNLFLGKEGGQWVVKPGKPIYRVCRGTMTVQSGTHYGLDTATAHRDKLISQDALPVYWVGRTGKGFRDLEKAVAFAKEKNVEATDIQKVEGSDTSKEVQVIVSYDRPKFGTPEERAARRANWMAYQAGRSFETQQSDYRPSRWELNYIPTASEDKNQ